MRIAVICCYNNEEIKKNMLLASLKEQQNVQLELRLINCSGNKYKSAAEVYNREAEAAESEYLVFVHQDLFLSEKNALERIMRNLEENPNWVIGLCGSRLENGKNKVYSNIYHGILNENMGAQLSQFKKVDALDECFVAIKKDAWKKIKFDEVFLNSWHFYVVDFCIRAKMEGFEIVAAPINAVHKSMMEMPKYIETAYLYPKEFYYVAKCMRKKYIGQLDHINSPCCCFELKWYKFYFGYYYKRLIKRNIKYFFRKLSLGKI